MKTTIFVPEKIKVGFQKRDDTYTKKLAYVIYYDEKNKLRKEASWNSWRHENIEPLDFENVPTSGFVLNKKAGGYSTGWNHRQTYVRVYDPRDFEFEITVPNLLYILENTNSIKGKGLEGEFVYGWDGTDLVLIPVESPDYEEISSLNKLRHDKNYIKSKDLVIGGTYKDKDNVNWIYMGRFDLKGWKTERIEKRDPSSYSRRSYDYIHHKVNKGKHYFFAKEASYDYSGNEYLPLLTLKSLGNKFIHIESTECVENYVYLYDLLERNTDYSHYDESKDEYVAFDNIEFEEFISKKKLGRYHYDDSFTIKISGTESATIHHSKETNEFYKRGNYDKNIKDYEKFPIGDVDDLFNKYKPVYKNEYLENGKLYRKVY